MLLTDLPDACVESIALNLEAARDILQLAQTCRTLSRVIHSSDTVWRAVWLASFPRSKLPSTRGSHADECSNVRRELYERLRIPNLMYFTVYEPCYDQIVRMSVTMSDAPYLSTHGREEDGFWLERACVLMKYWLEIGSSLHKHHIDSADSSCVWGEVHRRWFVDAELAARSSLKRLNWIRAFALWLLSCVEEHDYGAIMLGRLTSAHVPSLITICEYRSALRFFVTHLSLQEYIMDVVADLDRELGQAVRGETVDTVRCRRGQFPSSHFWWTQDC
mmetsp:Transcript_10086/g.26940  ORF Transcript_10086/g.26940 Transcript_10086/m.26940 type:complete len:276 (+) Transcript_10086:1017-1844(+)